MPTFSPQEVHLCEDGQIDIILDHPYLIGRQELTVFLNGMLAVIGEDYEEIDEYTIRFLFQLSNEDVVITQHKVYFDDKKISVIDGEGKGIFQQFGDEDTLLPTQEYTVKFEHDDQVFIKKFYTRMDPSYSTIKIIRNDLGDVLSKITDAQVAFQIYQNSIIANNIASEENLGRLEEEEKTPFVFKQYVRYSTELDLLVNIYMSISGRGSTEKKVLGELEIEYKWRLSDIRPLLNELKNKLKPWERELRGQTASGIVASAVRGGSSNPYALNNPRRDFSDGTGGGSE